MARGRIGIGVQTLAKTRPGRRLAAAIGFVRRWGPPTAPVIASLLAGAAPTATTAQASEGGVACGQVLSGPIMSKWGALGGAEGPLGCPVGRESASAVSPSGAAAREAAFNGGVILWHSSGPHAGQTFVVTGCGYRLYFQYGGASGWLGLPISDPVNTPDGQRQRFEGGSVRFLRAPNECSAERNSETTLAAGSPASKAPPARSPLDLFAEPARGDHIAAASAAAAAAAQAAGYRRLRTEAYVLTEAAEGTLPLKLYWNEAVGDHVTVATAEGERDALARGYGFEGSQGFVYAEPKPGTAPLKQFWNAASRRSLLTATPKEEADAIDQGYAFVRIEGYAFVAP